LDEFNALSADAALGELLKCCASASWAQAVSAGRPYVTFDALRAAADAAWSRADHAQRLEAFRGHPRIGGRDALRERFLATRSWAQAEQSGAAAADDNTLAELERGNGEYEAKFGFIFIVCASGKSAAEMLELLKRRLGNDPATEIDVAAAEQMKIAVLRLEKLIL
jgi:2-oxo-4-hydroxy-4-carboxy-5-ureidoimidazoline decarboxylase